MAGALHDPLAALFFCHVPRVRHTVVNGRVVVRDGQVIRGWIGVEPQNLSPELAQSFGIKSDEGVIITGVLQNGPAAQAGIRPGDVITRVAGREVGTVAQLLSAVAALPPGTSAAVDVVRRDGKTQLNVTPARRNPLPRQEQR